MKLSGLTYHLLAVLLLIILMVFQPLFSYAQGDIEFKAKLKQEKVQMGEAVEVTLEVRHLPTIKLIWPEPLKKIDLDDEKELEVLQQGQPDTFPGDNYIVEKAVWKLIPWDTGFYAIPPIEMAYVDEQNGTNDSIASQPLLLEVTGIPVDTTQPWRGIKGPMSGNYRLSFLQKYGIYLLALGIAIVIVVAVYFLVRYYNSRPEKPIDRVEPNRPAHIVALEKLEILRRKKLWEKGEEKAYHSQLTDIVREYIEARYKVQALESTTGELLEMLERTDLSGSQKDSLGRLLQLADLVKFAKTRPLPTENKSSMDAAWDFVEATKLVEEPQNKEEGT